MTWRWCRSGQILNIVLKRQFGEYYLFKMQPMPKNLLDLSNDEIKIFLSSFDTVLTDCDGVLWFENDVIGNAEKTMNKFRSLSKSVFFVTNNSTKTRSDLLKKCSTMGFQAKADDIVSTAYLTAEYLNSLNFKKKAYVIGSPGLVAELDEFGIKHTDIGADVLSTDLATYVMKKMTLDPEIGAVLVGFDQHFSYPKMIQAATYLNDPKCLFVATNTDERVPIREDLIIPGTGSLVKCIETCSGREAFVIGKPNSYIKDAIARRHGIEPSRTLMIGDRSNTDILFGRSCGFKTLLVLTGVTSLQEVESWVKSGKPEEQGLIPDYYIDKLGDLLPFMS